MIFVPSRPLETNTHYIVWVHRTARDRSGEMMPGPLMWRFEMSS